LIHEKIQYQGLNTESSATNSVFFPIFQKLADDINTLRGKKFHKSPGSSEKKLVVFPLVVICDLLTKQNTRLPLGGSPKRGAVL
jgi:hypothetical protein